MPGTQSQCIVYTRQTSLFPAAYEQLHAKKLYSPSLASSSMPIDIQ
jgi:hypothetical protein